MGGEGEFIIGIVGGGKGGFQILKLFTKSPLVKIAYVCDLNLEAPAMVQARRMGIPTLSNLDAALREKTNFIIEATGSKKVLATIVEKAGGSASVIEHDMARFLFRVVFDLNRLTNENVIEDIRRIRTGIAESAARISQQVRDIYSITNALHVVGINARVEAARIGHEGAGFDVVAQEVQKSSQKVRAISDEISDISGSILSLSTTVDKSLEKLATEDWGQED
ncbi:MAG: methyl-accepting chemotaxis protein [Candidatus Eisenbacteria bacterium]|nr:methyl-accepting chemotaxis protein [Candidatus Eisenbacteria bacterium]